MIENKYRRTGSEARQTAFADTLTNLTTEQWEQMDEAQRKDAVANEEHVLGAPSQNAVHFTSPNALQTSRIPRDAQIGGGTVIGSNVTIGRRTRVGEDAVLENGVIIGHDANIETESKLGRDAIVGSRAKVEKGSAIGAGEIVHPKTASLVNNRENIA
jgi:UDP-3-O-[3-hydroxymyristoyl] glucosamine N-acyltransferase